MPTRGADMQHAAGSSRDGMSLHGDGPCLQLTLRAKDKSTEAAQTLLKEREHALDLREMMLNRREHDLNQRERDLDERQQRMAAAGGNVNHLRKLACQLCDRPDRFCGRSEPCFDNAGFLLHHHHSCTQCHDRQKAARRARRAYRHDL